MTTKIIYFSGKVKRHEHILKNGKKIFKRKELFKAMLENLKKFM